MNIKTQAVALKRSAIQIGNAANRFADDSRGVIHRGRFRQASAAVEVEAQERDDRLAKRQAARIENGKNAFAGHFKQVHFLGDIDLIACAGARVGGQYQAVLCFDSQTIRHDCSSLRNYCNLMIGLL